MFGESHNMYDSASVWAIDAGNKMTQDLHYNTIWMYNAV